MKIFWKGKKRKNKSEAPNGNKYEIRSTKFETSTKHEI